MKTFREHLKEDVLPSAQVADGSMDLRNATVVAALNAALAGVTGQPAVTPYVVYNRISKLLAQYHIIMPRKFLDGDKGVEVFELRQYGHKMGMTDSGEFITDVPPTMYLFLQYGIISPLGVTYAKPVVGGMYRVMARIVDKPELDKLLDMAEITMSEEAECRQMVAKAHAPKEPMHDVTSDPKKKGNKEAVKDSEKGIEEGTMTGIKLKANKGGEGLDVMYKSPRMKKPEKLHTISKAHRGRWGTDDAPGIGSKASAIDSVRTDAAAERWANRHKKKTVKEEQIDEISKELAVKTYIGREKKNAESWHDLDPDEKGDSYERKARASEKRISNKFGKKTVDKANKIVSKFYEEETLDEAKRKGRPDPALSVWDNPADKKVKKAPVRTKGSPDPKLSYFDNPATKAERKKYIKSLPFKKPFDEETENKPLYKVSGVKGHESGDRYEKRDYSTHSSIVKTHQGGKSTKNEWGGHSPLRVGKSAYVSKHFDKLKEEQIDEKLTKKMSAGDVISDFVHSKDPKFEGKSTKERQKMALGAYYGMHPEKSKVDEAMGSIKKASAFRTMKRKVSTQVKAGLGVEGPSKTIQVTSKGDPERKVRRIAKDKFDPSKYVKV